jgi:hypothetical protein
VASTGPTTSTSASPTWARWLYPALVTTGIAVGIFIIATGLYLLIAQPGSHSDCGDAKGPAATASQANDDKGCCEAMKQQMENMPRPSRPSKAPMPNMSPMPGMPTLSQ